MFNRVIRNLGVFAGCLLFSIFILFSSVALAQDVTPPELTSFDFSPTAIDTTASSASVNVSVGFRDDLSGISFGAVNFRSPSWRQTISCRLYLTSGTPNEGYVTGTCVFPRFSEPGTWYVDSLKLQDKAGNYLFLRTSALINLEYNVYLNVTSVQDVTPPELTSFDFAPTTIDTSTSSASVNVSVGFRDDLSGISFGAVYFRSPSGRKTIYCSLYLTSGTPNEGYVTGTCTFPQLSEDGVWYVESLKLQDKTRNYIFLRTSTLISLGYNVYLTVISAQDVTPPELTSFDFVPKMIDASVSDVTVDVTVGFRDDVSGIDYGAIYFRSPSGLHTIYCALYLTSGTINDGYLTGTCLFPQYIEQGVWYVGSLKLQDKAGNYIFLRTSDLINLGYDVYLAIGAYTPAGSDITVTPMPGVTITFADVLEEGVTSVNTTVLDPPPVPVGYELVGTFYQITSTADYWVEDGAITLTLVYDKVGQWKKAILYKIVDSVFTPLEPVFGWPKSISPGLAEIKAITDSLSLFAILIPPFATPVANAGVDQTNECTSYDGAAVVLDGSGSTDPDSTPGTNDDIIYFDWYMDYDLPTEEYLGEGELLEVTLDLGQHNITLIVTDSFDLTDSDDVIIIVQDTIPPELSLTVSPDTLWPPNHKLVQIIPNITVYDICDPYPEVNLTSITSNEPDNGTGDGNTSGDIVVDEQGNIFLRAERSGKGNGRIYTINQTAIDSSNNSTDAVSTVTVPHDRGKKGK